MIIIQFRCGILPFIIERGKYSATPIQLRTYDLSCMTTIEADSITMYHHGNYYTNTDRNAMF